MPGAAIVEAGVEVAVTRAPVHAGNGEVWAPAEAGRARWSQSAFGRRRSTRRWSHRIKLEALPFWAKSAVW
jgi:hypothetical protein